MSEDSASVIETIINWVREHPLPNGRLIPVCIWGDRGTGKTAMINAYCNKKEIGFRNFHPAHNESGADIVGLPYFDKSIERTVHARPLWLPSENDLIRFSRAGLIFIDEINRAPKAVLQGLMEPLGEGTLDQAQWQLPVGWGFICAADPPRPGYQVDEMDEALMDRMVHIPLGFDVISWVAWAEATEVHEDLRNFTARFPETMAQAMTALPAELDIKATPRSMEYLARLYEPEMDKTLLTVLAQGLIGPEATRAFLHHINDDSNQPVTALEILSGNFEEKLVAHKAGKREDLITASQTLLIAKLRSTKYEAKKDKAVISQISHYLRLLGQERTKALWPSLSSQAPMWAKAIQSRSAKQMKAAEAQKSR